MRNQRTLVNSSPEDVYDGGEMRRRIEDCRERLRRNRASRRITERATPHTDDFMAGEPEPVLAYAGAEVREEKT
jgi:hypothetical protein